MFLCVPSRADVRRRPTPTCARANVGARHARSRKAAARARNRWPPAGADVTYADVVQLEMVLRSWLPPTKPEIDVWPEKSRVCLVCVAAFSYLRETRVPFHMERSTRRTWREGASARQSGNAPAGRAEPTFVRSAPLEEHPHLRLRYDQHPRRSWRAASPAPSGRDSSCFSLRQ